MASISLSLAQSRELLSRAIVRALESWPDTHRRAFVCSHYSGDSPEAIAKTLGKTTGEVRWILEQCDHWLRNSLHELKTGRAGEDSVGTSARSTTS
jgi:DNA-directed RNA polymerase specialized sigma24 family protein